MHNERFSDYGTQDISVEIIATFLNITDPSTHEERRESSDLSD